MCKETQAERRFCYQKILTDQMRQSIAGVQLLDNVFAGGSPVVLPPDRQRFFSPRQVGHQTLVKIARTIKQHLAPRSALLVCHTMSQHNKSRSGGPPSLPRNQPRSLWPLPSPCSPVRLSFDRTLPPFGHPRFPPT